MTVAWSTLAPMQHLLSLLNGLTVSGLQSATIGVPEWPSTQVAAYLTIGGQTFVEKTAGGQIQRTMDYRVVFVYATGSAEDTAETTVAALIDALLDAIYADRTLGSTIERVDVDATEASQPQYALITGQEFREWPLRVTGTQRKTYPVH
jgi:hypothetical protein